MHHEILIFQLISHQITVDSAEENHISLLEFGRFLYCLSMFYVKEQQFLTHGTQRVGVGHFSEPNTVSDSSPQGCVLSSFSYTSYTQMSVSARWTIVMS